jgi:glycosyltransferase involved in cell wall biosynthesis
LEALSRHSGHCVRFLGRISEEEKYSLLANAEVVLIPSLLEGFGIVVCEAIRAGTPVLVADRAALPEVVGVDDAVLPARDSSAWATAVSDLVADPARTRSLLARESSAVGRFSPAVVGSAYLTEIRRRVEEG